MAGERGSSRVGSDMARALLVAVPLLSAIPPCLDAQAVLTGSVTDITGAAVSGAQIEMSGISAQTRTDEQGNFRLTNVPMGETWVIARRLGFVPSEVTLRVAQQSGAHVTIRLAPLAATLPHVLVRSGRAKFTGRLAGYHSRLEKRSSGYFITREQIDRENPSTTGQLLQHVPGIQALPMRRGVARVRMRGRRCWPLVWIDGTPMPAGEVDVDSFPPTSIQGIELYLGSTTAPVGFQSNGDRSSCGTILIWSRGPDTDPIRPLSSDSANVKELISRVAVHTADSVDRRASFSQESKLNLTFPPSLFASRTPGLVIAEFVVDTLGRVEDNTVRIVSSTAPLFTVSVRAALEAATFVPAVKDGRPVRQLVQQPFRFDIGPAAEERRQPLETGPQE